MATQKEKFVEYLVQDGGYPEKVKVKIEDITLEKIRENRVRIEHDDNDTMKLFKQNMNRRLKKGEITQLEVDIFLNNCEKILNAVKYRMYNIFLVEQPGERETYPDHTDNINYYISEIRKSILSFKEERKIK